MEEDDNIWDILCDDYGLEPGKDEEDDECTIQYRKEMEEGCPKGFKTVWTSYGFRYEEEEEVPGEIILVPRKVCEICDRNAYHKNDWHCSQGKERKE